MAKTRINEASFVRILMEDIDRFNSLYLQARPVLLDFREAPKEMTEREWNKVASALNRCYQSVKCLFRIAKLAEAGILGTDMLCIMCYDEITGYLTEKLSHLTKWCGTGLDLAADYDAYELACIIRSLLRLVKEMDAINKKHGLEFKAKGNQVIILRFEESAREFLKDPGRFSLLSEDHVDNYVKVLGRE
jgi:hypothetical protein